MKITMTSWSHYQQTRSKPRASTQNHMSKGISVMLWNHRVARLPQTIPSPLLGRSSGLENPLYLPTSHQKACSYPLLLPTPQQLSYRSSWPSLSIIASTSNPSPTLTQAPAQLQHTHENQPSLPDTSIAQVPDQVAAKSGKVHGVPVR